MVDKTSKSFSIQVGGNQGIKNAGSLLDEAFSDENSGFTVSMGGISFGGESSFPKPKKQTTFATTATGNESDEGSTFDRPASTSKNMMVDCDMDADEQKS